MVYFRLLRCGVLWFWRNLQKLVVVSGGVLLLWVLMKIRSWCILWIFCGLKLVRLMWCMVMLLVCVSFLVCWVKVLVWLVLELQRMCSGMVFDIVMVFFVGLLWWVKLVRQLLIYSVLLVFSVVSRVLSWWVCFGVSGLLGRGGFVVIRIDLFKLMEY